MRRVAYDHPDAVVLTARVQAFYVDLYGSPDDTPFTVTEFTAPRGAFFVGYLGERPVAMGGWRFSDAGVPAAAARPAELKRMYVAADRRGQGLATQVLQALEADARSAGADWMILQTGRPQVAAVAFYRALGYSDIESFGHYAGAPEVVNLGRSLRGAPVRASPRSDWQDPGHARRRPL